MTMDESLFTGSGNPREVTLPPPPPWRQFPPTLAGVKYTLQADPDLIRAVNAAIRLRRPLLLTGSPGSGKSTVAEAIAHELQLGGVLRWNVTSRSTLEDAIYRYDAIGRLQHNQLPSTADDIAEFTRLGPLGTALIASTSEKPRVLLVDELDKGELDLPGDLLNIFERGEYEIAELNRHADPIVNIKVADIEEEFPIEQGRIRCQAFPIVVITSNGEREFPSPFLRRCIRHRIEPPTRNQLVKIVEAHLSQETAQSQLDLITEFSRRLTGPEDGEADRRAQATLAIDQLLNAVYLLSDEDDTIDAEKLKELLIRDLDERI